MDTLKPEIAKLFVAKEARRRKLARLPFPEKVRAVVRLQEMAAPVLRARGAKWFACGRWTTASGSLLERVVMLPRRGASGRTDGTV
jgi:hypothetical protein